MPKMAASTGCSLRAGICASVCAVMLLTMGCSNGRGSIGESAEAQDPAPPPVTPPTPPPEPPPTSPPPTPPPTTPPPTTPPVGSFTVGGTVTGLQGRGLVLRLNGANDLPIASNGSFAFEPLLASGSSYEIAVGVDPDEPAQTCTVANASGVVGSGDVRNAQVTCATNTYSIGGTVSGLEGSGLVLENSGQAVEVQTSGAFTFPTAISSGGTYNVTMRTQPQNPTQACSIANGEGTVRNQNIADIGVTCTTATFTVGGSVTGLAGRDLRLQNNGADDLVIGADGSFVFATAVPSGRPYNVSVAAQPTRPGQECTVENPSGTIVNANVNNVSIRCVTIEFTVGGTVTGLEGSGLILQNNGAANLAVAANGPFTFDASWVSGTPYNVTVTGQPANPTQVCSVAPPASGTIGTVNVTTVRVNCVTSSFNITVTVSGLQGLNLRLQNNGGDTLAINSNGTFTFPTPVLSGQTYNVVIINQPILTLYTCGITGSGTGTVGGTDVNVAVICGP
jgi:hypothetical protein